MAQITIATSYKVEIEDSQNEVISFTFKSLLELKSFLSKMTGYTSDTEVHLMEYKYYLNDSTHKLSLVVRELTAEDL